MKYPCTHLRSFVPASVSATLGLLPQCRPGSFICGVSLVCFKATAYGEAAALIADPGQFFKTPKDLCRLITAIQRLRWRVAVCIILHVHPTLLWLQRRALLMRKIKEAVAGAAVRIILLRKHILNPLRKRVMRRLSFRHGIRLVEQMVFHHFKRMWRSFKKGLAAVVATEVEGSPWPSEAAPHTFMSRNSLSRLGSHMQSDEIAAAACTSNYHPHAVIHPWNSHIFPIIKYAGHGHMQCHHVAIHLGNKLYGVDISAALVSKGIQSFFGVSDDQAACDTHFLPAVPLIDQQHYTCTPTGLSGFPVGNSGRPLPKLGKGGQPRVVRIAKHPLCAGLFLAVDTAANLVVAAAQRDHGPESEEDALRMDLLSPASTSSGEPSTCLPVLDSRAPGLSKLVLHPSDAQCRDTSLRAPRNYPTATPCSHEQPQKRTSANPAYEDEAYIPMRLTHSPIPPGEWLPRDLLHQVTQTTQYKKACATHVHPPTVRPLSLSFAHPLRTDCAIVVCLVQSGSKSSSGNVNTSGKLIAVLIDLVRRKPVSWIPLFFASHDISICARRNPAFLQQLSEVSSNSRTERSSSATDERYSPSCQRPTARSRSTMLSTVRLQPLWGNLWAVTGPSLLAVFSVNLRFLHHPPARPEGQSCIRDPPLRLLWNMPSIPVIILFTGSPPQYEASSNYRYHVSHSMMLRLNVLYYLSCSALMG